MPKGYHPHHSKADRQHRWSGDRKIISSHGYVKIRVGLGHPLADRNGYAYEHLVVWCSAENPRPPEGWLLHHRNEVKSDNRIGNLVLVSRGFHNAHHIADRGRDPDTGRLLGKAVAGRLLDGRTHDELPNYARGEAEDHGA